MLSSNYLYDEFYQDDDYNYLKGFEDNLIIELKKMVDQDGIKEAKNEPNNKIMISYPKYERNLIERLSFEITYKEIPCRSIILGNIPEETTEEDIKYLLCKFGDYKSYDLSNLEKGKVIANFYNLKDSMMMRASTIYINFRSIIMSFGNEDPVTDKKHPPNNGTIVVFNLPEKITDYEIRQQFEQFGEIRDIRKTPNKSTQRFVEFFDLRSAAKAKEVMRKKKLILSGIFCQINVEFSLPGNYRVNHEKYYYRNVPTIQRPICSRAN